MTAVAFPVYLEDPQAYMNSLSALYTQTFNHSPKFLVNDTFIAYAVKIVRENGLSSHYGARTRLLPKARELLERQAAFDAQIAEQSFASNVLARFIDAHTTFALSFAQEMSEIQKHTPYMYKTKSYPKTVTFMLMVYRSAYSSLDQGAKIEWESQMETSDFAIFERLTDLSILELTNNPPLRLPEFFQSQEANLRELRTLYQKLSGDQQATLKQKLMGEDVELDEKTLGAYRRLSTIRSSLQESAKVWSTLMHTIVLSV